MDTQKLLIADNSEEFCIALANTLQDRFCIKTCQDGLDALELLLAFQPDVAVLDLMMAGLDGITLIQTAAEKGIHPTILVTSRYTSDYISTSMYHLGVAYIMRKPCSISAVATRIIDLSSQAVASALPHADSKMQISEALLQLNIPTKLKGYGYIREGINLLAKDPKQSITKELYPDIAKHFQCTKNQVERSVRNAIEAGWKKRVPDIWDIYFPNAERRPSNATFIAALTDRYILHQAKDVGDIQKEPTAKV